jgi:hypothetical protein
MDQEGGAFKVISPIWVRPPVCSAGNLCRKNRQYDKSLPAEYAFCKECMHSACLQNGRDAPQATARTEIS